MNIDTNISLLQRLPAHAGTNGSDLFFHSGKNPTAALAGWISSLAADEKNFPGVRSRNLGPAPQKSFDNLVGSLRSA